MEEVNKPLHLSTKFCRRLELTRLAVPPSSFTTDSSKQTSLMHYRNSYSKLRVRRSSVRLWPMAAILFSDVMWLFAAHALSVCLHNSMQATGKVWCNLQMWQSSKRAIHCPIYPSYALSGKSLLLLQVTWKHLMSTLFNINSTQP